MRSESPNTGDILTYDYREVNLWRDVDNQRDYEITQIDASNFTPSLWSPNSKLVLGYEEPQGYEILNYDDFSLINRLSETDYEPIWLPDSRHIVGIDTYDAHTTDRLQWILYDIGTEDPVDRLELIYRETGTPPLGEVSIWDKQRVNLEGNRLLYTFPYGLVVVSLLP